MTDQPWTEQQEIDFETDALFAYEEIETATGEAIAHLAALRDTLAGVGNVFVGNDHERAYWGLRGLADTAERAAEALVAYDKLARQMDDYTQATYVAERDAEIAAGTR